VGVVARGRVQLPTFALGVLSACFSNLHFPAPKCTINHTFPIVTLDLRLCRSGQQECQIVQV
jgi:hypothetical protein